VVSWFENDVTTRKLFGGVDFLSGHVDRCKQRTNQVCRYTEKHDQRDLHRA
jgi:hypothetical protein